MKRKNRFRNLLEGSQNWKKPGQKQSQKVRKTGVFGALNRPAQVGAQLARQSLCGAPTVCRRERQIGFSEPNVYPNVIDSTVLGSVIFRQNSRPTPDWANPSQRADPMQRTKALHRTVHCSEPVMAASDFFWAVFCSGFEIEKMFLKVNVF